MQTALPQTFEVSSGGVAQVDLEVLSTEEHTPGDFGYASFGFEVVKAIHFVVIVFTFDENSNMLAPTEAKLLVTGREAQVLFDRNLELGHSVVQVRAGFGQYLLQFSKAGYASKEILLSEEELVLHFDAPVKIVFTGTGLRVEPFA